MLSPQLNRLIRFSGLALLVLFSTLKINSLAGQEVEHVTLDAQNWDQYAPLGKEVDAIYGDIVLRNENIVAVIARPSAKRNANMTVRDVGGAIIDLTSRTDPNDQLSCFYPGGDQLQFHDVDDITPIESTGNNNGVAFSSTSIRIGGKTIPQGLPASVKYQLESGDAYLSVTTTVSNDTQSPVAFNLSDSVRADRTFGNRVSKDQRMISFYDPWFHQAYGVFSSGHYRQVVFNDPKGNRKIAWTYRNNIAAKPNEIQPGESLTWTRFLFPGKDRFELDAIADQIRVREGQPVRRVKSKIRVQDDFGPVEDAKITIRQGQQVFGDAMTDRSGILNVQLEPGTFDLVVTGDGRKPTSASIVAAGYAMETIIDVPSLGFVESFITDENGGPIPCKVAFHGVDGTPDPNFGPDSRAVSVKNLRYSANGKFKQAVGPGKYTVIVSHGPEYDAKTVELEVKTGSTTKLSALLKRSVDSTGWVSADFHSHSSESGDNTSDQLGRVLNLLAEQFDFAPCTEHNRVDSYVPHLQHLNAMEKMATCTGMELTGSPLPINHQNAFPMIMRPRTQDGGGPRTSANPVVQIERLKFWDDKSEKLVQMNHPNLVSILGDKDSDGTADEGFERMFGFVDVVEVHPLSTIFDKVTALPPPGKRGNVIFNWLQLLNQGYRMPGVINADAHYNFHGSGFRRNYIRCSTDDPAEIDTMEIVRNSSAGKVVMSNGPFVSAHVVGQSPSDNKEVTGHIGDEVVASKEDLRLNIKVQCANWYDINRVQIVVNGRLVDNLNFTRREHKEMFRNGVVKFEESIEVPLTEDAHLIVVAAGEGLQLGRVMGPAHGKLMPIAITNPIFVDIDGDGFKPNRDALGAPILMPLK